MMHCHKNHAFLPYFSSSAASLHWLPYSSYYYFVSYSNCLQVHVSLSVSSIEKTETPAGLWSHRELFHFISDGIVVTTLSAVKPKTSFIFL